MLGRSWQRNVMFGPGKAEPSANSLFCVGYSWLLMSHSRYSPGESGGCRKVDSAVSPENPFEKDETVTENQVPEGNARMASTSNWRAKPDERKPSQVTVHVFEAVCRPGSPGTWYRLRYGSILSAGKTRGLWSRTRDNHS